MNINKIEKTYQVCLTLFVYSLEGMYNSIRDYHLEKTQDCDFFCLFFFQFTIAVVVVDAVVVIVVYCLFVWPVVHALLLHSQ